MDSASIRNFRDDLVYSARKLRVETNLFDIVDAFTMLAEWAYDTGIAVS